MPEGLSRRRSRSNACPEPVYPTATLLPCLPRTPASPIMGHHTPVGRAVGQWVLPRRQGWSAPVGRWSQSEPQLTLRLVVQ